ncbi:MAG: hypothetical protein ACFCVF_06690, partial [Kineosporiaceae bacterium]
VSVPCPRPPLSASSTQVGPANRLGQRTIWHLRDAPVALGWSVRVEQRRNELGDTSGAARHGLAVDDSADGLGAFRAASA